MLILKQSPNDEFTIRMFVQLDNKISVPHDSIYLWSIILDKAWSSFQYNEHIEEIVYRKFLLNHITEKYVVIGIKDHLTSLHFNPWVEEQPNMVKYLSDMFTFYADKTFILFTSLENLGSYLTNPNLRIIPWGGDITNQRFQYVSVVPVINKNFSSDYTFLSLNRNARPNRFYLLSLLAGLNLIDRSMISCMFQQRVDGLFDLFNWQFTDSQQHIKELINAGIPKLASIKLPISDDINIYSKDNTNDNVGNFKNVLTKYYQDTFIEIICETSYTEKCFQITEKTQNSILGCNFPIWISSVGTVKFLRDMGLDVFDDIIDHSYDLIENPIDRMYAAITLNKELLTDTNKVKELWKTNKNRFLKNVIFIKVSLYEFYETRAVNKFNEIVDQEKL